MPSHLVFISLFLGIVSGKQAIEMQADANVASIRITLAGREIARLTQPPWRAEVDLGPELVPRELEAIGYDAQGSEVARVLQVLNLPRPHADVQIVRTSDGAQLRWRNIEYRAPRSARVRFDGAPLNVDPDFRVRFPASDDARPHVIDVEMRFEDGVIARREAVIEGNVFSDTAETQLTPVLLTETSPKHPASWDGCLSVAGEPVRVAAIDKDTAVVVFVQNPDARDVVRALDPTRRAWSASSRAMIAAWARLDEGTVQEIVWPVAKRFSGNNESSLLFDHTGEMPASDGLTRLLTFGARGLDGPLQIPDAVAVAGIIAITGGRRRAVVLVLGSEADGDPAKIAGVRRYLESIGVPLFVWSPFGSAAAKSWGNVEDISNIDHLRAAAAKLRKALAAQRIAWVHTDPLSALRLSVDARCGFSR